MGSSRKAVSANFQPGRESACHPVTLEDGERTTRPGRKTAPTHRPASRPAPRLTRSRNRRPYWLRRPFVTAALASLGLVFALLFWAVLARHFAPLGNTNRQ